MQLLGGLVGLALPQDGDRLVIDGDNARPAALGCAVDALTTDDGREPGGGTDSAFHHAAEARHESLVAASGFP